MFGGSPPAGSPLPDVRDPRGAGRPEVRGHVRREIFFLSGDSTFRPYDGPIIGSDCVQYGWPLGDFIN
eukprot:5862096-Pyramimonas_sp.AAC.1